jgi:regulator of replication initiation timing
LTKRCVDLEKKNTKTDRELSQVKSEFNVLLDINTSFSNENEDLKRRVREYDESGDDNTSKITKKGKNV